MCLTDLDEKMMVTLDRRDVDYFLTLTLTANSLDTASEPDEVGLKIDKLIDKLSRYVY